MEFEDELVVTGGFDGLDESDEVAVEFEEEADLAGGFDRLDKVDGLPEEETDSEDRFSAAEFVVSFPFGAPQPAVKISSADKPIKIALRNFI